MDISLVLREPKPGQLVYTIPLWYRILMVAIAAVLVASIAISEGATSTITWIVAGLSVLAALYEERWVLDSDKKEIRHRFGLLVVARTLSLPLDQVEGFRLRAFVRGSNPGAPGAAEESARILSSLDPTGDAQAMEGRKARYRRAYITLLCDDLNKGALVINTLPARRAAELKEAGARLASLAGKSLVIDS